MALSALQQRSRSPGPRILSWQGAAHECVDCQPYVRERYRTVNVPGIDERIRAKAWSVRNESVIQHGSWCDLRRRIRRINIMHFQYDSYIAANCAASSRRSARVQ